MEAIIDEGSHKIKYYRVMGVKLGLLYSAPGGEWSQRIICARKELEARRRLRKEDLFKSDSTR